VSSDVRESIILRFHEFDPDRAESMVRCARDFAVSKIGGKVGRWGATVYAFHGWACVAYWTKARAVVVRSWSTESTG